MNLRTLRSRVPAAVGLLGLATTLASVPASTAAADETQTPGVFAPLQASVDLAALQGLVDSCAYTELECGVVVDLAGNVLGVGDTAYTLERTAVGCGSISDTIGILTVPGKAGLDVTVNINDHCEAVISAINATVAVDTGAGIPPAPETANDAVVDPVTGIEPNGGVYDAATYRSCYHQGWSKTSLDTGAGGHFPGFHTNAEVRIQGNWTSTGSNGTCYGASNSNITVNLNSKYTYCYANNYSNFTAVRGCWYSVAKSAPYGSNARIHGRFEEGTITPDDYHIYDAYSKIVATKNLRFGNLCWTGGNVPAGTEMHCAGRMDY